MPKQAMIRVEIGGGRSKMMTIDEYLNIDYQYHTSLNDAEEIGDPFYGSALHKKGYTPIEPDGDMDLMSFENPLDIPDLDTLNLTNEL